MSGDAKVEHFSTVILAIYRAARETPAEQFQDAALSLLETVIDFDTSMWGSGTLSASGMTVHSIHLLDQAPEVVSEWMQVSSEDTVAYACTRRPGWVMNAHMPTLFNGPTKRAMRDYTTRFEKGCALVTRYDSAITSLVNWISLYRANPDRHFLERDRRTFEMLAPHVAEALTINRRIHLDRAFAEQVNSRSHVAIIDRRGGIHTADPAFEAVLRSEWSNWDGGAVPLPLLEALVTGPEGGGFHGRRIVVGARPMRDLLFLHARPLTAMDQLSPRESEVARRYGNGQSYKEVARAMGISPTTVRNHLQVIYDKLGVRDKVALANQVARKP